MILTGVTKRYRRGAETVIAVDDVSVEIGPGLTVIVGPSGSGKTTLLNLVVGWELPDEGTVVRASEPAGAPPGSRPDWNRLAIVPQSLGLLDELSVGENVSLPARFGATQHVATARMLEHLGLDGLAERLPSETSLGEQQRTSLARALCTRPAILLADEPTSHQDEANTMVIVDELAAAATGGASVLVATHDPRVITRSSTVLHLLDGRLVER